MCYKVNHSHYKRKQQAEESCKCGTCNSHMELSDKNVIENNIKNPSGKCCQKTVRRRTVNTDEISEHLFSNHDRSTEQPPVDISFTIFHQQWGCTKHLQDEWQPEKNKRRDKSANDNGSSHAYRESPAGFIIFLSTDMKSSKRTSACRKGKCDTVQNIYKRIDNVDRSECICSNISRNKDSINDRINCSK